MGRQHIRETPDGPALYVKQRKTGVELLIPIHPKLGAILDATPSEHLTFLVTDSRRRITRIVTFATSQINHLNSLANLGTFKNIEKFGRRPARLWAPPEHF
jgi:hypothetical protein